MSSTIIRDNVIDLSQVRLSDVKQLDNGGRTVFVNYGEDKLVLETPAMIAPFGVSNYVGDKGEASEKWSLQLSFGNDMSPSLASLKESLMALDEFVLQQACKNSLHWVKQRNLNKEAASMLYSPSVRFAKDRDTGEITDKYPPTFRMTVPTTNGQFTVPTYLTNKKKVDLASIDTKRAKINAIVQCSGVWIAGSRFGVSWKVVQLRVAPSQSLSHYAFSAVDEDETDDNNDNNNNANGLVPETTTTTTNNNPVFMKDNNDYAEEDDDDLDF